MVKNAYEQSPDFASAVFRNKLASKKNQSCSALRDQYEITNLASPTFQLVQIWPSWLEPCPQDPDEPVHKHLKSELKIAPSTCCKAEFSRFWKQTCGKGVMNNSLRAILPSVVFLEQKFQLDETAKVRIVLSFFFWSRSAVCRTRNRICERKAFNSGTAFFNDYFKKAEHEIHK